MVYLNNPSQFSNDTELMKINSAAGFQIKFFFFFFGKFKHELRAKCLSNLIHYLKKDRVTSNQITLDHTPETVRHKIH